MLPAPAETHVEAAVTASPSPCPDKTERGRAASRASPAAAGRH